MAEKTDYRSMFDREYIGSFDLPLGTGDLTLTIKRVIGGELTAMGGRKSKKPIVHFREPVKPLICNKTNSKTIASLYGNFVESWAGKQITLFRSTTRNPDGGDDVECIRVRPQVIAGKGAPAAFDVDGEDPAITPEQVAEINGGLDIAGSVAAAKFKGLMAKEGWKEISDIPQSQFESARKFINNEIDKKAAKQPQGEHHPEGDLASQG